VEIPVLIESVVGNGYRARSAEPLACQAEGASQDEALQNLRQTIEQRLAQGATIVPLEISAPQNPMARFAGMFKDDPLYDEWQRAIAELRRQADADPDYP
jgi:hypothetical protein